MPAMGLPVLASPFDYLKMTFAALCCWHVYWDHLVKLLFACSKSCFAVL